MSNTNRNMNDKTDNLVDSSNAQLMDTIFHSVRFKIIKIVSEQPQTFTNISNIINVSSSEVSRHLNKLYALKVIEKDAISKKISLTLFGKAFLELFTPIEFIFRYKDFFNTHDISGIPIKFIQRFAVLQEAELVSGTGPVMFKMTDLTQHPQEWIKMMVDQPFPFGKGGLEINYIVPSKMLKYRDKVEKNKASYARILDELPISVTITDFGEGFLFFRDSTNKLDYNEGFFVTHKNEGAYRLLLDMWDYFWSIGADPGVNGS